MLWCPYLLYLWCKKLAAMKDFYSPKIILDLFSSFHSDIIPPIRFTFSCDIRLTLPWDNPLQMFPIAVTCGNTFVLKPSEKDPGDLCFLAILQMSLIRTLFIYFFILFHFNLKNTGDLGFDLVGISLRFISGLGRKKRY